MCGLSSTVSWKSVLESFLNIRFLITSSGCRNTTQGLIERPVPATWEAEEGYYIKACLITEWARPAWTTSKTLSLQIDKRQLEI